VWRKSSDKPVGLRRAPSSVAGMPGRRLDFPSNPNRYKVIANRPLYKRLPYDREREPS
jgi:hypothetical protein